MCGRFHVSTSPAELARVFGAKGQLPNFGPRYNVAPTDVVPVIRFNPKTGERSLDLLRWGLIPSWAKDEKIGYSTINARAEGIETKPAFREAIAKRRCLVPADGFYEWKKLGPKEKQPYHIRLKGGGIFAFAGLWEGWKPLGRDEWLRTFTIATTTANELCAPIHDRMPVILDPADWARWLAEEGGEAPPLELLKPFPAERMEAIPIGAVVGNVKNEGPELIEPLVRLNSA
jgi:putative SOS response-associated peptidase YedK